jgi:beta-glucosidase-like glycosyl hydrolase
VDGRRDACGRRGLSVGYVLGAELRACGVELSFTPVLDLDHGRSDVVGDRAFHRDPRVVAMLAQSLMLGLQRAGMQNCAKHFPGHGHAVADSHVASAVDGARWRRSWPTTRGPTTGSPPASPA